MLGPLGSRPGVEETLRGSIQHCDVTPYPITMKTEIASSADLVINATTRLVPPWAIC
jgi:hypothetical protein